MLTENELKALEERIDASLKDSGSSEAYKQALKERLIIKEQEMSEIRAIRGLDIKTGRRKPKIMLPNGIEVNADAFDD